jgi:DNA polymerase III alpha subunit
VVVNDVGHATARRILAERRRRGAFRDETDFRNRMELPERVVSSLISAGALEGMEDREWRLIREIGMG